MYKITVSNKFDLYKYTSVGNIKIGEFDDVYKLIEFNKRELQNGIILSQLIEALEYMQEAKHDTAEFGINGYFTISYNEADNV